ncbi:MAG: dihydrodipicolinate synthase family protein [Proteobacteria bacterium]|nr:dihydrodipicolinate synthase family protein [Pseudomonadota bacterium]
MAKRRTNWNGSFPALMTPFTRDGALDERMLRANVELAIAEGVHGVIICGHNGEAHVMSREERRRVAEIGVEVVNGRVPVVIGTGAIRTEDVIDYTRDAKAVGADGAMIEAPYFLTPQKADVTEHYVHISEKVDLPVMMYNNPKRAGVDMDPEQVSEIADKANVVAIKDSKFDYERIVDLVHTAGDRIQIFVGPARVFGFQGIQMGAHGFVDELQQLMGRDGTLLYDYAKANDAARGIPIQHQAFRLHKVLMRAAGSYPATIKDAMRLMSRPGGYSRRPLRAMEGAALKRFADDLRAIGLLAKDAAE